MLHYWHVLWELMSECISCAGIFTLIWDLLEQRSISFLQLKKKKWAKSKKNQGQKQGRGWSSLLGRRHHRQPEALSSPPSSSDSVFSTLEEHGTRSRSRRFSGMRMLLDNVLKLLSLVFKMTAFMSLASYKIMVLEINILHWNLSVCNKLHDYHNCVHISELLLSLHCAWKCQRTQFRRKLCVTHCCHPQRTQFRGKLCVTHTAVTLIFLVISVSLREKAGVGNRSLGRFSRVTDLQFYKTLAGHGTKKNLCGIFPALLTEDSVNNSGDPQAFTPLAWAQSLHIQT